MKQFDNRGRRIDYDAPGQLGRHSKPPEKLPRIPRFQQQLDRLTDFYNQRGEPDRLLRVTLSQLRGIMHVKPEDWPTWKPSGTETYRNHPFLVIADEDAP